MQLFAAAAQPICMRGRVQDMYLQRRHVLSAAPPQLHGTATMTGAVAGVQAASGRPQPQQQQQGYTATFMPTSSTQHLPEDHGRAASVEGARPSKHEGMTASAPALDAAVGPERVSTGSAPPHGQQQADRHEARVPWVGTRTLSGGDGAAVGGPAGFGSTMSTTAGDGSIRAQQAATRFAGVLEDGSVPGGSAGASAPDVPTHPFAIEVGPADDRYARLHTQPGFLCHGAH